MRVGGLLVIREGKEKEKEKDRRRTRAPRTIPALASSIAY